MIRWIIFFNIVLYTNIFYAKEWKSLKAYQLATQNKTLLSSDWLKSDRTKNTTTWKNANVFNLINKLPQEYTNIVQRRDFYKWMYVALELREHEVIWVKMAHFISKKMHLIEVFPYSIFTKKLIKTYVFQGSEIVFNGAFIELKRIYHSQSIIKNEKALEWDKAMLRQEQFLWIQPIYNQMDSKNSTIIRHILQRKFPYCLVVPKSIQFREDISKPEGRYN
ncbi:MAG: Insecticidal toxin complex protein [Flaviramulus sp.]|nr:Insecticidal toxin complex protein [Flaviramulus sp.]NNC50087.1 Insecticidal toxin complex protein [Flaviramulus sp.]